MGRLIAVLALAGAAAFAAHPASRFTSSAPAAVPAAVLVSGASDASLLAAQEKDLASRENELGLVGAAPLFGAEGLPKPDAVR
jgi:hypothetical protein